MLIDGILTRSAHALGEWVIKLEPQSNLRRAILWAAMMSLPFLGAQDGTAQVYAIKSGDIVVANYRAGGDTVVRMDPQTGSWRRLGQFTTPTDVALSPEGYLYVSEWGGTITRLNLTNGVETIVNPGGTLSEVWGLALGPAGELFVASAVGSRIVRLDPVTGGENLVTEGGQISSPLGIDLLDAEHVVVASQANNQVVSVSLVDGSQTVLAQGAQGIDLPWGVAVSGTDVYVGAHDSKLLQTWGPMTANSCSGSPAAASPRWLPSRRPRSASGRMLMAIRRWESVAGSMGLMRWNGMTRRETPCPSSQENTSERSPAWRFRGSLSWQRARAMLHRCLPPSP